MKKITINRHKSRILRLMMLMVTTIFLTSQSDVGAQCTATSGTIEGIVFTDVNDNGVNDLEPGIEGVYINVYDENGILAGSTFSDSDGLYNIAELIDGKKYKIVFSNGTSLVDSRIGTDNQSGIRFETSPVCNVSYGLKEKAVTCGDSPDLALTCFVQGDVTTNSEMPTIVGTTYSFDEGSAKKMYATHGQTGSVWGLAWKNTSQEVFTSAFVKQFSGLKSGPYAIFKTDINDGRNASLYIDLKDAGIRTESLVTENIDDCLYGNSVGRRGLGGLTISSDESTLFVAVLDGNQIAAIPTENASPSNVTLYNVPAPTGMPVGEEYRVFALEQHEGDIYVGVTITGSVSAKASVSEGIVMKLDIKSGSFTEVFRTNYIKGFWQDDKTNSTEISHWLTDIDFTDDGNMILSLTDRLGHRFCRSEGVGRVDQQYPDILMVGYNATTETWTLESNGSVAGLTGSGVGNGQGPGNGEFFGNDNYPGNPLYHNEVALGSVTILPGTNSIVATVYDPLNNTYSGGLHRYSTIDGSLLGAIEFYTDNVNIAFGKASGFGDVATLCGKSSIEVGNYIWVDSDDDGIQDANETPVSGIKVALYDVNCNLVEETTTDAKGRYLFSNDVLSETDYFISVGYDSYDSDSGLYEINGEGGYSFTLAEAQSRDGNSNGTVIIDCVSLPVVAVNTKNNDYSYDIGFRKSNDFDLALTKELLGSPFVSAGDVIGFEIKLYNQGAIAATNIKVTDYIPGGLRFLTSENPDWTNEDGKLETTVTETVLPGKTHSVFIKLEVQKSTFDQYTNYAEITDAEDIYGNTPVDIDSTPDGDSSNDTGGIADTDTDDKTDGDGSNDEDDHDPARVKVFDLALKIELTDDRIYYSGQDVQFDITVYNQGAVDASVYDIINYVPVGLLFDQEKNPDWGFSAGKMTRSIDEVLEAGLSRTFKVNFTIGKFYREESIVNYAEITNSIPVGGTESIDFDSTPDDINDNDIGGVALSPEDNQVLADPSSDEDDHDPVLVRTGYYDLALMKTSNKRNVKTGTHVIFDITVSNQGTGPVDQVEVIDYLPEGLTLVDDSWEVISDNKAVRTIDLPTSLEKGDSFTTTIEFIVDESTEIKRIINVAEILHFTMDGEDYTEYDVDSVADDIKDNDAGGVVDTNTDDNISMDSTIDEDDQDPAILFFSLGASFAECLNNATTSSDGQYRDDFIITSESGSDWYIESESNYYDISSAAPPVVPTSFASIGASGVFMTENVIPFTGFSVYTFSAIRVEGTTASIVFTDGVDVEGFTNSDTYLDLQFSGSVGVCMGGIEEYTITNPEAGETYTWSLPDGGTFVGGVNEGTTVMINWDGLAADATYDVVIESDGCTAPLTFIVSTAGSTTGMQCDGHTNVSLDQNCEKVISPYNVYDGEDDPSNYIVMLTDENGEVIPNATLTSEHIGQEIEVKILDGCGTNSCWGIITVEDKIDPVFDCVDEIELSCTELDSYEGPVATDNCNDPVVTMLTDEVVDTYFCDDAYTRSILRRYVATDSYGNQSEVCEVTINLLRLDLDAIVAPINYTMLEGNPLNCGDFETDENGNPALSVTMSPTYLGVDILPDFDGADCNLAATYTDVEISDIDGVRKIQRTFIINETHCAPETHRFIVQNIDIVDVLAPVITCPEDLVVSANALDCIATFELPQATAIDECTDNITFKISSDYFPVILDGEDRNVSLQSRETPYVITYEASDERGNISTCTISVTVEDNIAPTVICDSYTVVGLNSHGEAYLTSMSLDDGTFDNCGLDSLAIRRMDGNDECDPNGEVFSDRIKLCCSDFGQEVMVVLGAWDMAGNFNQCMVTVSVQDKTPPVLEVPEDVALECGDEYLPLSQFGIAEVIDSCNTTLTIDSTILLNDCGIGTITRTFTAFDGANTVTGQQVITIINPNPFDPTTIQWPEDLDTLGQCDASLLQPEMLPTEHGFPVINQNMPCDNVAYTFTDEIFTYNNGLQDNCYTIIRKWTVRDWCQTGNAGYTPTVHDQMIKVRNEMAPDVSFTAIGDLETLDCDGINVSFDATADDDCTPDQGLHYEINIDVNNDGDTANDINYTGIGGTININEFLPIGTHSVLYTFTDACGNDQTSRDEFTVVSNKPPISGCWDMVVAISPMDLDGDGDFETEAACIFADSLGNKSTASCDVEFYLSFSPTEMITKDTVTCDDVGFITRTIYAVDIFGNYSECIVTIEVQDNNMDDICVDLEDCVTCPDDILQNTDSDCQYTVTSGDNSDAMQANDECGVLTFSHNYTGFTGYLWNDTTTLIGAVFPLGTTDIIWTARNENGRTFDCNQQIVITDDINPTITCNDDVSVNANMPNDCAYQNDADLDASADDNCNVTSLTHDYIGYTGYEWTDDTTLDNAVFPVGTTIVTWTAIDAAGNSIMCVTELSVSDDVGPFIVCAGDVSETADDGVCYYTSVANLIPETGDVCGTVVSLVHDYTGDGVVNDMTLLGAEFPVGTTTVTWTATDDSGNEATCSIDIVVEDNQDPVVTECFGTGTSIELNANVDCEFELGTQYDIAASDNCMVSSITHNYTGEGVVNNTTLDGAIFPLGSTTVVWTVVDASGNDTTCEIIITVVDGDMPSIVCVTDPTLLSQGVDDGECYYTSVDSYIPVATDGCGTVPTVTHNYTGAGVVDNTTLLGAEFPVGSTIVTWTATDDSGNSESCMITIMVSDDVNPVIVCGADLDEVADDGVCHYTSPNTLIPSSSDACGTVASLVHDYTGDGVVNDMTLLGAEFPVGTTTVTWTATDDSGNEATCSIDIVVEDNQDPNIIECFGEGTLIELDADVDCEVELGTQYDVTVNDNCGVDGVTIMHNITGLASSSSLDGLVIAEGETVSVIWTVTDAAGNTDNCDVTFTVVDNTSPVCGINTELEVTIPLGGQLVIDSTFLVNAGSDNCSDLTYNFTDNTFDCGDLGTHTVSYSITDDSGNTSTCDLMINIVEPPFSFNCNDVNIYLDSLGVAVIDTSAIVSVSTGCSDAIVTFSDNNFLCNDYAMDNPVTVTVYVNVGGTLDSCTTLVTIIDTIPPTIECPVTDILDLTCDEFHTLYGADINTYVDSIKTMDLFGFDDDNCFAAGSIYHEEEYEVVISSVNSCGYGDFHLSYTLTDTLSGLSDECTVIISITQDGLLDQAFVDGLFTGLENVEIVECISDISIDPNEDIGIINTEDFDGFTPCSNISFDHNDSGFNTMDMCDEMFERTWTVVDSCQLSTDDPTAGVFTFVQTISVIDTIAPIITVDLDTTLVSNNTCDLTFDFDAYIAVEDCNDVTITTFNLSSNTPTVESDSLYVGLNIIEYVVTDVCGNEARDTIEVPVIFDDEEPFCTKLFLDRPNDGVGEIVIKAEDHFIWLDPSCVILESFQFSFSNTDINDTLDIYDCALGDGETSYFVFIYFNGELIDSCKTLNEISDPDNVCGNSFVTVKGTVETESGKPLSGFTTILRGSEFGSVITDEDGKYSYNDVAIDRDYKVTASNDDFHANGVNVIDLIKVQRHILGLELLDSPYKLIAADVNDDSKINATDLIDLRKVILRINDKFTDNVSWRGISKDITFMDASNPWYQPFEDDHIIENLTKLEIADFIGVKVGDVNNSNYLKASNAGSTRSTVFLSIEDDIVDRGTEVNMDMKTSIDLSIYGLQVGINAYDLELGDIKSDYFDVDNAIISEVSNNEYTLILSNVEKVFIPEGAVLFSIEGVATADAVQLSEALNISNRYLENMIFTDLEYSKEELSLRFRKADGELAFSLEQNRPNPWVNSTNIGMYLPTSGNINYIVRDITGKVILNRDEYMNDGNQVITLDSQSIPIGGVYYLEVIHNDNSKTIKIIKLK